MSDDDVAFIDMGCEERKLKSFWSFRRYGGFRDDTSNKHRDLGVATNSACHCSTI